MQPTDLSEAQFALIAPVLPAARKGGRPRSTNPQRIVDAVVYVLRTGCPWRLLPAEYPPWGTVWWCFRRWRLEGVWHRVHEPLRRMTRERAGRHSEPSAAVVDSQSIRTSEGRGRGYDAGKRVFGRKRHIMVVTEGLLIASYVTPAGTSDREGCKRLLAGRKPLVPRLALIWADSAYAGAKLASWCRDEGGWTLQVIRRRAVPRFEVVPRRWVVERTFAWLGRNRRLARDYERMVQTTEIPLEIAMLRRLTPA